MRMPLLRGKAPVPDEIDAKVIGAAGAVEREIEGAEGLGDGVFEVRASVDRRGDVDIRGGDVGEERSEVVVFLGSWGQETWRKRWSLWLRLA